MTLTADAAARHLGALVDILFADGVTRRGTLAAIDGDEVEVEHTYGGGPDRSTHEYTARYTLVGDGDTPAAIAIAPAPVQSEVLF